MLIRAKPSCRMNLRRLICAPEACPLPLVTLELSIILYTSPTPPRRRAQRHLDHLSPHHLREIYNLESQDNHLGLVARSILLNRTGCLRSAKVRRSQQEVGGGDYLGNRMTLENI